MGALSLCSLCECDLGLHLVSLPSALGLFVGSYLRSPATQWCGTWLMPDRKLPWCLLTKYRATCWVTFHISERKGVRCRRTSTGCQERPPCFLHPWSGRKQLLWRFVQGPRTLKSASVSSLFPVQEGKPALTATVLPAGWCKPF